MKSGRSDSFKPSKLGLNCNVNKCSDVEAGDLCGVTTHEKKIYHSDGAEITQSIKLDIFFHIRWTTDLAKIAFYRGTLRQEIHIGRFRGGFLG